MDATTKAELKDKGISALMAVAIFLIIWFLIACASNLFNVSQYKIGSFLFAGYLLSGLYNRIKAL